jgi:hypothetical protein
VNVAVQNGVSAMGRRKAGAGGGHAVVLSAGMGWEARRAAGLGVRPETAAEATGRPPGQSLGAFRSRSIHWRRSNHGRLESGAAFNWDWAGWEQPWRCGLPKLVWLESGVEHTQTVAGWERPCTVRSQSCMVRGRWSRNLFRHQTRCFSCLWELLRSFTCFWGRTCLHTVALRTTPSPIFPFLGS